MPRLSQKLAGPTIWIKRDDQTGLAFGGNKTRKLEYLVAEAQANGAKTLITAGAVQSNHCRQTAAAAARSGFDCQLVLGGSAPARITGNLLLDQLMGAKLHWAGDRRTDDAMDEAFEQAWKDGKRPYKIPVGGSNPVGSAAYAFAMREFLDQHVQVDRIIVAVSSGGTYAGMLAGAALHGFKGKITGIRIGRYAQAEDPGLNKLAIDIADRLGKTISDVSDQIDVRDDYLGEGYGILSDLERGAIRLFAETEGVILDPVYTGRAAGGMVDLIRGGEISSDESVLFWHTGGTPALFAYAEELI
jgi:D-cysteine desulfhydrase family pyridoxal phosphate-dependent enzyme